MAFIGINEAKHLSHPSPELFTALVEGDAGLTTLDSQGDNRLIRIAKYRGGFKPVFYTFLQIFLAAGLKISELDAAKLLSLAIYKNDKQAINCLFAAGIAANCIITYCPPNDAMRRPSTSESTITRAAKPTPLLITALTNDAWGVAEEILDALEFDPNAALNSELHEIFDSESGRKLKAFFSDDESPSSAILAFIHRFGDSGNSLKILKLFLKLGIGLDLHAMFTSMSRYSMMVFWAIILIKHKEILTYLLSEGMDSNAENPKGETLFATVLCQHGFDLECERYAILQLLVNGAVRNLGREIIPKELSDSEEQFVDALNSNPDVCFILQQVIDLHAKDQYKLLPKSWGEFKQKELADLIYKYLMPLLCEVYSNPIKTSADALFFKNIAQRSLEITANLASLQINTQAQVLQYFFKHAGECRKFAVVSRVIWGTTLYQDQAEATPAAGGADLI